MSEYCDGCGEWDLPDGTVTCDTCDDEFCPACIEDGRCDECQPPKGTSAE